MPQIHASCAIPKAQLSKMHDDKKYKKVLEKEYKATRLINGNRGG